MARASIPVARIPAPQVWHYLPTVREWIQRPVVADVSMKDPRGVHPEIGAPISFDEHVNLS